MGPDVAVNCLTYTRWPNIWRDAKGLFVFVARSLPEDTLVDSVSLQYVNVFSWSGRTEDYDSKMLLNGESSLVPDSVLDHGPYWHLHQGWFSPADGETGARFLDRMHIDAIDDQKGTHVAKLESFHRFDFERNSRPRVGTAFITDETMIDATFDRLHDRAKASLAGFLTLDAQRSINLHAT